MIPSSILIYSLISLTLHEKCKNPSLKPHINCFKTTLNKTTTHSINQLKLILASKFLHFLCNQPFPLLSSNLANNLQLIYETKAKEKKALSWTEETRLLHETKIEESNTIHRKQWIKKLRRNDWEPLTLQRTRRMMNKKQKINRIWSSLLWAVSFMKY